MKHLYTVTFIKEGKQWTEETERAVSARSAIMKIAPGVHILLGCFTGSDDKATLLYRGGLWTATVR